MSAALNRFAETLEALFSRPVDPGAALPFVAEEIDVLLEDWDDGRAALPPARGRKGTAPPVPGDPLQRAAFWHDVAVAKMTAVARLRCAPLEPLDGETPLVFRWLVDRETAPDRSPPAELVPLRAAAFALAHAAWGWNTRRSGADRSRLVRAAANVETCLEREPTSGTAVVALLAWWGVPASGLTRRARQAVISGARVGPVPLRTWWPAWLRSPPEHERRLRHALDAQLPL